MVEPDTIKLLRECDAGIKMGVASIDGILGEVKSKKLKQCLTQCKREHETLKNELNGLLARYQDHGKDPNPIAKSMSRMKTGMKMAMERSDHTIADLMTDGCNMGVKSLNRYLNMYQAADEVSKDITKRLIHQEEQLTAQMRPYL